VNKAVDTKNCVRKKHWVDWMLFR